MGVKILSEILNLILELNCMKTFFILLHLHSFLDLDLDETHFHIRARLFDKKKSVSFRKLISI